MNKPFFSVVMPTRNRAKLLSLAVGSVLKQTFGDFEVIVSDNFSADETAQTAHSFDDERIKYFRSENPLSIGDSYKFALSHAKGEYITFLSDDDAYAKVFLQSFSRAIEKENAEVIACRFAFYYSRDAYEYGRNFTAESLAVNPFSRELHILDGKDSLTALFASAGLATSNNSRKPVFFPRLVNAAYKTSMVNKVKERISNLFPMLGSDIYTSALFLNAANKFCYIDEPLYLHRLWEGGATSGGTSNLVQYGEDMDYAPLKKLLSVKNYHANAFLRARSDWGEDFQPISLDLSDYFVSYYQELIEMQIKGVDISEELEEFESEILKQDKALQEKLQQIKSNQVNTVKTLLKIKLKNSFVGMLASRIKHRKLIVLSHQKNNFKDILECAAKIDENFLSKYANN